VTPIAVIDVGSNSGRVVVLESDGEDGHLEILADSRSPLRLARDVEASSLLSEDAIERTVAAMKDFRTLAKGSGAGRTIAVATAAIREAENGAELLERVRRETGIAVRVVTGEEEARYGFLGAVHGLQTEHGVLVDIGGGSLEVSLFRDRQLKQSWSLPLGALRLSEHFLRTDPPTAQEVAALTAHVQKTLRDSGVPELADDEELLGTGGTVRNLAKVDRQARSYPIAQLHGYVLNRRRAQDLAKLMASRKLSSRKSIAGLSSERADSMAGGALVCATAMEALGAEELVVSGQGLREGIAYDALGLEVLPVERIRSAAIRALVRRFSTWDPGRAARRVAIALRLLAVADPEAGPKASERLEHACTVLDIGRTIDFYRRFEHTAQILLAADLTGFTYRKLALLAAVVHHAGVERWSLGPYRPLLSGADRIPVARGATILAMADAVEHRVSPRVSDKTLPVRCEERGRRIVLSAPLYDPSRHAAMADRFQRAFERPLVIEPDGGQ
jgi:exopolyphosphatase/guanosine-5'-triphosphate,3'-diphosphate pyrophosphatase